MRWLGRWLTPPPPQVLKILELLAKLHLLLTIVLSWDRSFLSAFCLVRSWFVVDGVVAGILMISVVAPPSPLTGWGVPRDLCRRCPWWPLGLGCPGSGLSVVRRGVSFPRVPRVCGGGVLLTAIIVFPLGTFIGGSLGREDFY